MNARSYFPGIGDAVADRTVNRRIFAKKYPNPIRIHFDDPRRSAWEIAADLSGYKVVVDNRSRFKDGPPETRMETWYEVAHRVAEGNAGLTNGEDFEPMFKHLAQASLLMSGRHLQHGDSRQKDRNIELFSNCSTAATSFLLFKLLLNGSGVGRSYDDSMMLVDWNQMPKIRVTIRQDHPDVLSGFVHPRYPAPTGTADVHYMVGDSREGWGKALELIELMTFQRQRDKVLELEFSDVRENGKPIRGMQNRPASGPGPLMDAIYEISKVRDMGLAPWEACMHVDHRSAECVLVGGARRAARMATKTWRDPGVLDFISFKHRNNFWSSNNSVTIDDEFRERCTKVWKLKADPKWLYTSGEIEYLDYWAWKVLYALAHAAYHHGTGEPGLINQDRLVVNDAGIEDYVDGLFAQSSFFEPEPDTIELFKALAERAISSRYSMIVNPCGEISLLMLGGYCVIADVVPFHASSDDDAEEAFRVASRALIRTNLMEGLYSREIKRTNRIGVGITGFHEWAYSRFGFTWYDIINEEKSKPMWEMLARFRDAVIDEATWYSRALGVTVPHSFTTFKPAGTTSKLFGLTEGAHLPSMRWYLRWVQFRNDDPLIEEYQAKGYPTKQLTSYNNTTVVGFPTALPITEMDGGEWVVTAGEATPEQQYEFLRLLEKYWLGEKGNQISYTLKYDPEVVSFEKFLETLIEGQFTIRCCSVMPQMDASAYEYQPEEPITKERYVEILNMIQERVKEDVDFEHVDCSSGACPIDFKKPAAA